MEITGKKQRIYDGFVEGYYLSGSYKGRSDIPIGVLILYILLNRADVYFCELIASAEHEEIGVPYETFITSEKRDVSDLDKLVSVFKSKKLVEWECRVKYNCKTITFFGRANITEIGVSYGEDAEGVNLLPLLSSVEAETWEYHCYSKRLIENLKSRYGLTTKTAVVSVMELEKFPDIWEEFRRGLNSEQFSFPQENAVSSKGYTAETLCRDYLLSELGAYNYLIYLRENPEEALENLKKGLPRK